MTTHYTLYKHTITLTVITPECSPDSVIAKAENAFTDAVERASGTVTKAERAATPYMRIAAGPNWPTDNAKDAETRYFAARDIWLDSFPTVDTFRTDGTA